MRDIAGRRHLQFNGTFHDFAQLAGFFLICDAEGQFIMDLDQRNFVRLLVDCGHCRFGLVGGAGLDEPVEGSICVSAFDVVSVFQKRFFLGEGF